MGKRNRARGGRGRRLTGVKRIVRGKARSRPLKNPPGRRFPRVRRAARAAGESGAKLFGVSFPPIRTLAAGAAGMAAVRTLPNLFASKIPSVPTVGPAGILVRAVVALLGGRIVAQVAGGQAGKDFTLGGMLSVADELSRTYVLPAVGLSAYLDPGTFGAYLGPGTEAGYLPAGPGLSGTPMRLDTAQRFG